MRTLSRARRLGLAAGIAMLAACSARGTPASRPPSGMTTSCSGQRYVDVRNNLSASVEVYGYVGSVARYLGTVPPGVHRLPLFEQVGYMYAELNRRRVSASRGLSSVSFTHGCERA